MIAAAILAIGVNLGSVHGVPGLNNFNPGLYAVTAEGYAAGIYHNSHKRPSVWAGKQFATPAAEIGGARVSAALLVGGITGYGKPSVLVSPSVAFAFDHATYRFSYAPRHPSKPTASDALHLSVEFEIGGGK